MTLPAGLQSARAARRAVPTLLLILLQLTIPASALSGEWRVTPIRLDLGKDAKSGAVTVINETDDRLQLQMNAVEWTQDGDGKDRYEETGDILFFPRIMIFEKKGEKILRAGIKGPPSAKEKTYRLFLEEIPEPKKPEGAQVAIAIRFGVPIFVRPLKDEIRGEIGPVTMSSGTLRIPVRNAGNAHFMIQSIRIRGKGGNREEIFSRELSGWYLLAGASRLYTTAVPPESCGTLSSVDVEVRTDKLPFHGQLVADPSMCAAK